MFSPHSSVPLPTVMSTLHQSVTLHTRSPLSSNYKASCHIMYIWKFKISHASVQIIALCSVFQTTPATITELSHSGHVTISMNVSPINRHPQGGVLTEEHQHICHLCTVKVYKIHNSSYSVTLQIHVTVYNAVTCSRPVRTTNVDFFDSEGSRPCGVYWYVMVYWCVLVWCVMVSGV